VRIWFMVRIMRQRRARKARLAAQDASGPGTERE
jgi:hypothetical protein